MKTCSKCNIEKPLNEFNKNKSKADGYHVWCKQCVSNNNKKLYNSNSEIIKQKINNYYYENKVTISTKLKEYRNKPEIKQKQKEYIKQWVKDNNEHYKQYQNEYKKQYYKDNPHALVCLNIKKRCLNGEDDNRVNYTSNELKQHIELLFESWMTWSNIGKWEVHHNVPVSWFKPETPPNIINDLNNLYPISKEENRNIKDNYIKFKLDNKYIKQIIPWIKEYRLSTILTYL
jgi:hypothetical protein